MNLSKHDLLQMNDEWLEELSAEHLLKVSKRLLHDVKVLQPGRVGKRPYRLPTRTRNGEIGGQTKKRLPNLRILSPTTWALRSPRRLG